MRALLPILPDTLDAVVNLADDHQIAGLTPDSRAVEADFLFAALPGVNAHGITFIGKALQQGASVVLTDAEGFARAAQDNLHSRCGWLVSDDPRAVLAHIAAGFFGVQPETVVAVTGTNGKTSVATFTRQLWRAMGLAGVNFGTAGVEGQVNAPLSHTTPEPVELHRLLASLAEQGVTHAAMEASSHGLAQRRLDGVTLAAAGFTHLTRDHLDYHETPEAYEAAKALLFNRVLTMGAPAVVNIDTEVGCRMADVARGAGHPVFSVGQSEGADLRILSVRYATTGQRVTFRHEDREYGAELSLIGAFQVENAMLAAGLAVAAGAEPTRVFAALPQLSPVSGRMELAAQRRRGGEIYVDYSHTPDSIETALTAIRPHVSGKLIAIVGAGGDRDKGKRPLMGKAAREGADAVIVTDDNPRSEDPATIRAEVLAGAPDAQEIGDRAEAIRAGASMLGKGDVLLICGKGHETGQMIVGTLHPFDDRIEARKAVEALDGEPGDVEVAQ
ncbi:UDP-N-acetylmuramoyl-L-alanyl-D-glutamate--2,6-diaminopimelate ligase [Pontivivens insulae]|uniref:UDP-N-acetylmuramoyl-L-alanyl-D-glutamate--2,6-diaminopimelate ligase n=1 Tax=Pontivivens insulae TaxID=1639689 RepID=A0A2R8AFP6_9RHOB|nr:UDP-N-acetylmuramoyl-L-alanyl-D-glutamate--2,6-diaminopimelate ligase [Pontivivens insulae]RED12249.1 UDP-N-acetylmuramoylalanyl-D-glutamate--2,6-diaminopimelate ligase [Pontivivens insulae]SPF31006.1 UDP-N-acetylmuramoyl-L-alanyl-D-glutamate--2, 6-diaminopimelate ligase [Pontivivens insulae]